MGVEWAATRTRARVALARWAAGVVALTMVAALAIGHGDTHVVTETSYAGNGWGG